MPKRKRPTKEPNPTVQDPQPQETEHQETHNGDSNNPSSSITDPGITNFEIPFHPKPITCERHQPKPNNNTNTKPNDNGTPVTLIFTHGAGGGISAPAIRDFGLGFSQQSPILCFQGSMNLTNRVKAFHTVAGEVGGKILGGRSMGARAAVLTALEMIEEGKGPEVLVLVSWPLTAGKEGKREPERREGILQDLPEGVDVLFILGEQDVQCEMGLFEGVRKGMKARSWVCVVEGADHGMGVGGKEGSEGVRRETGRVAAEWIAGRDEGRRRTVLGWDRERGSVEWRGWKKE